MKKPFFALVAVCLLSSLTLYAQQYPEEKAGWMLGAQAYSFNRFTFADALRKIDSCGLKYIEMFTNQRINSDSDAKTDFKMDAATRQLVKKMLADRKLTVVAYGVVKPKNEDEWKQMFAFAKALGIRTINTEPTKEQFAYLPKLAEQYKINLAIHNHPKPTPYWHPDSVLAVIGNSPYIGACADIGHWVRSGLNPVECLKRYEGKLKSLHFKDVTRANPTEKYHDVVWGTGDCNIAAVLTEMKRQQFKGPVSAEYEYHWENNAPEIAQSVQAFRRLYSGQ